MGLDPQGLIGSPSGAEGERARGREDERATTPSVSPSPSHSVSPSRHPPIRAVFLDVGGTLLEMGSPEQAYCDILAQHGHRVSPEQVSGWLEQARLETRRRFPPAPSPDHTISAERELARRQAMVETFLGLVGVTDRFDACRGAIRDSWLGTTVFRVFPEAVSVLAQLKRAGLVLGVVSNWEPRLAQLCANHGLAAHLDFILASEAEGFAKPGPRLFQMALERAGVEPGEALHVGDNLVEDVRAAESLGIRAVLVQRQGQPRAEHSPTVTSLEAVVPLATAAAWIKGRVESGRGEAAGFTALGWVQRQVARRLGFRPYPGTLNLRLVDEQELATWRWLQQQPGVPIEPSPGYCAARCFRVSVEGRYEAAIVLPLVPHYPPDVVEVLAPLSLRQALGLADGTAVTLAVVHL